MGFLPAVVNVRDNIDLSPNEYRLLLKGVPVGGSTIHPDKHLVIATSQSELNGINGEKTTDPSFGMPAVWVDNARVEQLQLSGYTVVDPGTIIGTHISQVLRSHATELLGREEVQDLIDHIKQSAPKLIEDIIPKVVPIATLQKVLQNLLTERVSIRDTKTIIEALAEHIGTTTDTGLLTSAARVALSRQIIESLAPGSEPIPVISMETKLESMLVQAFSQGGNGLDGGMTESLLNQTAKTCELIENSGGNPILLVNGQIRLPISRFLKRSVPSLNVLAHEEIPDNRQIRITHVIGA